MIARDRLSPEQIERTRSMAPLLRHRGPDGEGEYLDESVLIGMRRLSIIDLEGGWQPLYNEDRSLVLVANGEIYNFVELRQELEARGHRFRTNSDCETILHLYEEHREDCVKSLRGMFAFALWDARRNRLFLARDRMGEKPVFLFEKDGAIVFASEIRALLCSRIVPFDLDPDSVNLYFHYKYVPEPFTPIKGIRKLPAAHHMTIECDKWAVRETCYWRMEDAVPLEGNPAEIIGAELRSLSKIIIRSDVPVGVALSGGLDSSVIAALAVENYPGVMQAFCVGYSGSPDCDERESARAFADYLGMPFHDIELDTDTVVRTFPDAVFLRDDPIADISGVSYYSVMQQAREHGVPVMLQGQGGDELFWGYPWVKQALEATLAKQESQSGAEMFFRLVRPYLLRSFALPEVRRWVKSIGGIRDGWNIYSTCANGPADQMVFYDTRPAFQYASRHHDSFYTRKFADQLDPRAPFNIFTSPRPWKHLDIKMTRLICQTYLLENGMQLGDRLSMASSVELRLPLVDYRLVETVVGLRKNYQDYKETPKSWFKASVSNIVPEWVMNRAKRGFAPPGRRWLRALFDEYGLLLADGYLVGTGILAPESARAMAPGSVLKGESTPASFAALLLEVWCRKMLLACGEGCEYSIEGLR